MMDAKLKNNISLAIQNKQEALSFSKSDFATDLSKIFERYLNSGHESYLKFNYKYYYNSILIQILFYVLNSKFKL